MHPPELKWGQSSDQWAGPEALSCCYIAQTVKYVRICPLVLPPVFHGHRCREFCAFLHLAAPPLFFLSKLQTSLRPVGTNPELCLVGINPPWCWCRQAGNKSERLCDFFFAPYVLIKLLPSPCTASAAKNAPPQNEDEKSQCSSAPSRLRFLLFGPRNTEVVLGAGRDHVFLVAGCGCCHVVRGVPGQLCSPWRERLQLCSS